MWRYRATVVRVVDADTIDCVVDLGFRVSSAQRLRLLGVDAPETRGAGRADGLASKAALEAVLPEGRAVVVETAKGDRWGRWLARVSDADTGACVNDWLVEHGHAAPWPAR